MFKIGQKVTLTKQGQDFMSQEYREVEYDMFIVKKEKDIHGIIRCTNLLNNTDYPFFDYELRLFQYNPTLIDRWELSK